MEGGSERASVNSLTLKLTLVASLARSSSLVARIHFCVLRVHRHCIGFLQIQSRRAR